MHWKPMKRGDCNNSKAVGSSCATPSSKGWVSLGENSVNTFPILSFPCRFLQLANLLSTLLDVPFISIYSLRCVSLYVGLHGTKV